jgi:hypothetical protein
MNFTEVNKGNEGLDKRLAMLPSRNKARKGILAVSFFVPFCKQSASVQARDG